MNFRNENQNIEISFGKSNTHKQFIMSDLSSINVFLKNNPKYSTVTETIQSNSAKETDLFRDISTLGAPKLYGKIRFTCDDASNSFKRFVVSEDCDATDKGATIKSIYELKDVAAALTNNPPNATKYPLCYDFKTWTEFPGF